jgi:oligoendopeptidase F
MNTQNTNNPTQNYLNRDHHLLLIEIPSFFENVTCFFLSKTFSQNTKNAIGIGYYIDENSFVKLFSANR